MPENLSKSRLRVFRVLLFAFPVIFFLLLEGGLRFSDYGQNLDLFIPVEPGFADQQYMQVNPDVAMRYFTRVDRTPRPTYEMFLKKKPANGYRIFMMGGSTMAGWPFPNNVMSSRVLNQRLSDAFPDRNIEIVNVGIAAVNSYTLLDFVDEILAQKPDAILIYAGHNEFYGALGAASVESVGNVRWIINTYLWLLHFKTVQWLRDVFNAASHWASDKAANKTSYDETYPTLMSRMIANTVAYDSISYRLAERNYRENLRAIMDRFTRAGVPVMISELVSNIRDMAPFVSAETAGQPAASTVFQQARALEQQGKYDEARAAYYKAKDLDAMRFRAPEDFNAVIHQVAEEYDIPVVPMKAVFEAASPHGLIGSDLILEHLHPNATGYMLLADAFFESMRQHGFITKQWDATLIKPAAWYAEHWPVTELDRALGMLRTLNLMDYWPFRPPSEPGHAFADFKPSSRAEAFAYRVEKRELPYLNAHFELGKSYAAEGQHELALREYEAVIASAPYDVEPYLAAAMELLRDQQFDAALNLLRSSLEIKDTPLANKWIGQILMYFRKPHDAVPYLEKAARQYPDDPRLLYNLGGAYAFDGQKDRAREILAQLERLRPDYPSTPKLKNLIETQ